MKPHLNICEGFLKRLHFGMWNCEERNKTITKGKEERSVGKLTQEKQVLQNVTSGTKFLAIAIQKLPSYAA